MIHIHCVLDTAPFLPWPLLLKNSHSGEVALWEFKTFGSGLECRCGEQEGTVPVKDRLHSGETGQCIQP